MKFLKTYSVLNLVSGYLVDSPQPSKNINSYLNFYLKNLLLWIGFYLVTTMIIIIGSVLLVKMVHSVSILEAFDLVKSAMKNVNNDWLIRSLGSIFTSAFYSFLIFTVFLGCDIIEGLKLKIIVFLYLTLIIGIFLLISIQYDIIPHSYLLSFVDTKQNLVHVSGVWYVQDNEPFAPVLRQFFQQRCGGDDHISNLIMRNLARSPYTVSYRRVLPGGGMGKVLLFLQPQN